MTFEEEMIKKIDNGELLTSDELKELVFDGKEIDKEYGENRRWSRSVVSIIEICERYFSILWDEGLTEIQENEFYEQPVEVEKKEYDKTIHVVEWIAKNKKDKNIE